MVHTLDEKTSIKRWSAPITSVSINGAIPEPGGASLIGLGLSGLWVLAHRMSKRGKEHPSRRPPKNAIVSGQNRKTETLADRRLFFMRNILVLLCFAFTTSAASISVGPVYISGLGSFEWYDNNPGASCQFNPVDCGWSETLSASGSSGSDYVSFSLLGQGEVFISFSPFYGLPTYLPYGWGECCWYGDATIDGISGEQFPTLVSPCGGSGSLFPSGINSAVVLFVGNGGGFMDICDPEGNLLAAASLIGYVQYTNVTERFNGETLVGVNADFIIVPTPEPATWGFCLVGLAIVAFRTRKNCVKVNDAKG